MTGDGRAADRALIARGRDNDDAVARGVIKRKL